MWSALRPHGLLFITETPHRYWPTEGHTTGLPFINYVPDALAGAAARHLSGRGFEDASWGLYCAPGFAAPRSSRS
jgi:hypothetical protein